METADETRLHRCLTSITEKVNQVLSQLVKKPETTVESNASKLTTTTQALTTTPNTNENDSLFNNSLQNNNVNTFTVDNEENELLDTLTNDIQNILRDCLPQLPSLCSVYIEQYLHQYHFNSEKRVFTEGLTPNVLYAFKHDLDGLLLAARAYPAALKGDVQVVGNFLKRYPMYKDKPGFWGTTLLYSAARNDRLRLVQHLIETCGCAIDAQNETEMAFALINDNDAARANTVDLTYNPDPKLASTALHAACFCNNLEIVKYLIGKGANHFLRNQLGETPIQNGKHQQAIQEFFRDYLVPTYTNLPNAPLPTEPTLDCHDRKPHDCIWEYKPVKGLEWEEFTVSEHNLLSATLKPGSNSQSFNTTTYLSVRQGTFSVNLLIFLRGSKNQEPNPSYQDSLAWIRCRGSSIANFDIHCVWQFMFVKYDTKQPSKTEAPSLDSKTFPSLYDSKFEIKLNSWYTCDLKRNALLDDTMNYRRRYVDVSCNFDINENESKTVKCNLFTFTFTNNDRTILGFIRWIPKLIANTPSDKLTIKVLNNFKMISSFNPIPLETKRLEQLTGSKSAVGSSMDTAKEDDGDSTEFMADFSANENGTDDGDDDTDTTGSTALVNHAGTWSLNELQNDDSQSAITHGTERC